MWAYVCIFLMLVLIILLVILIVYAAKAKACHPCPEDYSDQPCVFGSFYSLLKYKGWAVLTGVPGPSNKIFLNFAYPDRSQLYFICSFGANDQVIVTGKFPENLFYWALTLYDECGLIPTPVADEKYSYNDLDFPSRQYQVMFQYTKPYSLFIRFYASSTHQRNTLYSDYLPTLTFNVSVLPKPSLSNIKVLSQSVEKVITPLFTQNNQCICPTIPTGCTETCSSTYGNVNVREFFLVSSQQLAATFPNANGLYLVLYPPLPPSNNLHDIVVRVTGSFPSLIGPKYPMRYFSYMASNASTSATDDTIGFGYEDGTLTPTMSGTYTLWFGYDKDKIVNHPLYQSGDMVLLFHSENDHPVLVLRQICVQNSSCPLFSFHGNAEPVPGDVIQKAMGSTYPVSQILS